MSIDDGPARPRTAAGATAGSAPVRNGVRRGTAERRDGKRIEGRQALGQSVPSPTTPMSVVDVSDASVQQRRVTPCLPLSYRVPELAASARETKRQLQLAQLRMAVRSGRDRAASAKLRRSKGEFTTFMRSTILSHVNLKAVNHQDWVLGDYAALAGEQ